jgi:hypothetical protein
MAPKTRLILRLQVKTEKQSEYTLFRIRPSTTLKEIFTAFCARHKIPYSDDHYKEVWVYKDEMFYKIKKCYPIDSLRSLSLVNNSMMTFIIPEPFY